MHLCRDIHHGSRASQKNRTGEPNASLQTSKKEKHPRRVLSPKRGGGLVARKRAKAGPKTSKYKRRTSGVERSKRALCG